MKSFNITNEDLANNPAPRCTCMLVLDTSSSMEGQPINELNEGLKMFWNDVRKDEVASNSVEVGIVTFGGRAKMVNEIENIMAYEPPVLTASGMTPMGSALEIAISDVKKRKKEYKNHGVSYYQPWIVLVTDGQPNDNWEGAANAVKQLDSQRKCLFFGVGVGDGVDMDTLKYICPESRPPKRMSEVDFREFFQWLSASLKQVSMSSPDQQLLLPSTVGWEVVEV